MIAKGNDSDLLEFYDRHNGRLLCSYTELKEKLQDWNVFVLLRGKHKVAVIVEKDGAAHLSGYRKQKVGIPAMREAINTLYITRTTVSNDFKPGHALAKRLGFTATSQDEKVTHYALL